MSTQTNIETENEIVATELDRSYYYRPCKFDNGQTLKCAGHGAESPEHRAFYEPFFNDAANAGKGSGVFLLPGVVILKGYHGDKVSKAYAESRAI